MRDLLSTLLYEKKNKISGGIYNKLQVDFAFNSNHMEGSHLTHDQTRYIFETKTIGADSIKVNDIFEAANHFNCFGHILDTVSDTLTHEYIKRLHYILKSGIMEDSDDIMIGEYKKYPNEVGGVTTSSPENVFNNMDRLLSEYNADMTFYDIINFHVQFEKIHPFYDGNGRIGRLLMFKQCLANNITPFFINDENKMFYYMGLKEWQTENKKSRLIDVCLSAQDDMKIILKYFRIDHDDRFITVRDILEENNL